MGVFIRVVTLFLLLAVIFSNHAATAAVIVSPKPASPLSKFAAQEVRRYVYLRTGTLLDIVDKMPESGDVILIERQPAQDAVYHYRLQTATYPGGKVLRVLGNEDTGVLYAAYRLAHHMGVRFYMHGDVIPDARIPFVLPEILENGKPQFEHRGIQPFHDFPEGPDWWNTDDYKAVIGQLPKMRMNFFGLHTYPEQRPAAEPTVWIGPADKVAEDGTVKAAYPSLWFTTAENGWGYAPKKTSDYAFGAAGLYDRDNYGGDAMRGFEPMPDTDADCAEVFKRAGTMLREAFTFAHRVGVQTCVGTETPLVVPRRIQEGMAADKKPPFEVVGGNPADYGSAIEGADKQALYQSVTWDVDAYRFPVANGACKVTLKFCEVHYDKAGARVFDVAVEGKKVIEKLDIFAHVGKNHALDFTFDDVSVSDGRLDIEFSRVVEFPAVAGIVIEGPGADFKVNCGGPAFEDYVSDLGLPPMSREDVRKIYEGVFTRIMRTYPIDYYWFWTPETWTWADVKEEDVKATINDIQTAIEAAKNVNAPFMTATCGWVLGPQYDRALFDNSLPKSMPVSCINRQVGYDPVEAGFERVQGRPKWAIPWMEDDPALASPQLWAGRMRRDAYDAARYKCTGLMGIHWRTRILGPNVSALAQAAWDQRGWSDNLPAPPPGGSQEQAPDARFAPIADFYRDWATAEFGAEVADDAAAVFAKIDGRLPRASNWTDGPGGFAPDQRPADEVLKGYAFVEELSALRGRVKGAGNVERFDYWLSNFRYMRATSWMCCLWHEFNAALDEAKASADRKKEIAAEKALPARKQLVAAVGEAYQNLLGTVSTNGGMGNVTNLEHHTLPKVLEAPGKELEALLGELLPADAQLPRSYVGPVRIIVPSVRTALEHGEPLRLKVIVLARDAPKEVALHWRPLGGGEYIVVKGRLAARQTYYVDLADAVDARYQTADFEYYVDAVMPDGSRAVWPATAPELNQTVVIMAAMQE